MLDPLLDSVEKSMRQSLQLTWTSLELDELYSLIKGAASGDAALDRSARAVHRLLALMLAVHMTATASKVSCNELLKVQERWRHQLWPWC